MTDTHTFERFVAQHLADDGSGTAHAERIAALIDERTRDRRQLPRWLALMKESPMRIHSHVAVGSPAVRVAAILVATMLLAVTVAAAGAAGQRLLAANGPIVVAQDGSGDFTTIAEAVADAEDGDEILVRPGTYPEVVVIDKDITLRGDGQREEVILEFTADGPTLRVDWGGGRAWYGVMLVDTEAIVSDLTVRGPTVAVSFVVVGGAPTLTNVVNELEGDFSGQPHVSVAPIHGAGITIRESLLDGPVYAAGLYPIPEYAGITGSGRIIAEDNVGDAGFWLSVTDGSAFLRNTLTAGEIELSLQGGGSVLIAGNETYAIQLEDQSDGFTIRDNVVHGAGNPEGGILLGPGSPIVEGNVISDAPVGITVLDGGAPTITGNQLERVGIGIRVDGATDTPVIEGNRFCGNEQDLVVPEGSSLVLDPSNEVCDE